ncbi:hypothetical protein X777_03379 [Ooceraea biroi]|uniref:Uncharacterized protein n=1 Tax=Ooceraea biroi TaxID=2015173 RepID=A0A026X206_OOCBI|nr:hypothetical protein X777_03379 [Ooceraea biroi]
MANTSFSSSLQSFTETYTEEQKLAFLTNVKMDLQAIQKATDAINKKFKAIQEEMHVTDALIKAIDTNNDQQL